MTARPITSPPITPAVIRPVVAADFDQIFDLAKISGGGMTNLPNDEQALRARIDFAVDSFVNGGATPSGETYLMVLERDGQVIGTTAVFSAVGLAAGFINYKILEEFHQSQELGKKTRRRVLIPSHDFTGSAEVGSLFLSPDARGGGFGKFLSRARYLFMAQKPEIFDAHVCAELRGWRAPDGSLPFWEALGRHFFDIEFEQADLHNSAHGNQFIQDLLPRHPVYEVFLGDKARACMGKPHDGARPAYEMLIAEGFEFNNYIDIFDGGPLLDCPLDRIKTVRESIVATIAKITDDPIEEPERNDITDRDDGSGRTVYLAAVGEVAGFRCVRAPMIATGGYVTVDAVTSAALGVSVGDKIRIAPW